VFANKLPKGFPVDIALVARRKLRALDASTILDDLKVPPGNRLERLRGDRDGQHSIRVNDQWRLCFVWQDGDAYDVEIADYHSENQMAKSLKRDDAADADWSDVSSGETIGLIAPGKVLRHEFMEPLGISARALARDLAVPANLITRLLRGETRMTARTAILLSGRFGNSAEFWMNLQTAHDLEETRAQMGRAA